MARRGAGETTVTPDLVLRAYRAGLFPMAERRDADKLYWLDPDRRGIQPLDDFHLPRRLARTVLSGPFEVRCDTAFAAVLEGCAAPTEDRPETWINPDIERLFGALHEMGHAHSVECWQEGRLVGGLYGVALGGAFFGESMFSRVRDASKVALVHLVARLRLGGFALLDTQFVTDHLARFGAIEVPRLDYRRLLAEAVDLPAVFHATLTPEQLRAELTRMKAGR
jgi:leucyl/phenylalanyl-tRNA--protein transferase